MTIAPCCPALASGECGSTEADLMLVERDYSPGSSHSTDVGYRVCISVLSDFGILPGDVLRLPRIPENELPLEISGLCGWTIRSGWQDSFALGRLLVPPRQLIANSICILPQLILGPTVRIVAAAPWNEFFPRGRTAPIPQPCPPVAPGSFPIFPRQFCNSLRLKLRRRHPSIFAFPEVVAARPRYGHKVLYLRF